LTNFIYLTRAAALIILILSRFSIWVEQRCFQVGRFEKLVAGLLGFAVSGQGSHEVVASWRLLGCLLLVLGKDDGVHGLVGLGHCSEVLLELIHFLLLLLQVLRTFLRLLRHFLSLGLLSEEVCRGYCAVGENAI
jgi:hypothetical protein